MDDQSKPKFQMSLTHEQTLFSSFSGIHPAAISHLSTFRPKLTDGSPSSLSVDAPGWDAPSSAPGLARRDASCEQHQIFAILFLETFADEQLPPLPSIIGIHRSLETANASAVEFWRNWPARQALGGQWNGVREEGRFGRFRAFGFLGDKWCCVRVVGREVED